MTAPRRLFSRESPASPSRVPTAHRWTGPRQRPPMPPEGRCRCGHAFSVHTDEGCRIWLTDSYGTGFLAPRCPCMETGT